jgi:hypothetical protein
MKITELLSMHIVEAHQGGNWTEVDVKSTLADVSYKEASVVTAASHNTIAALLNHMTFYNEVVIQRLSGINPAIDDANGFHVALINDEPGWIELREQNLMSATRLAMPCVCFGKKN